MGLPLPPASKLTPADAPRVRAELDRIIAGRPGASTTYQFYDDIDAWLGPWGAAGYPIGYGKKYNILFSTNPPLNRDIHYGKPWVENTTIYLQEAIRDYIVGRVSAGTIGRMTEPELRAAAFDSHPACYLKAGLLGVCEKSPELFLVILAVPIVEFNPASPNFMATIKQVFALASLSGLANLLRTALGALSRSTTDAILLQALWKAAAARLPGIPPLPAGERDDNFADSLGLLGGVFNVFDR